MRQLLSWVLSFIVFAAIGGACVWGYLHAKHEDEGDKEAEVASRPAEETGEKHEVLGHDDAGRVVLTFDHESQIKLGIRTKPLEEVSHRPEMVGFGTLQEDPSGSFTLRPPLPGRLRPSPDGRWPSVGDVLGENATIGSIEPRLGPAERADLRAKLATEQADIEEVTATLEAERASYESKLALNKNNKIVSDQVLQESAAKVKGEEARLRAARETVRILEQALTATSQPSEYVPLVIASGGKVVEVFAQPGEAVEAGQAILRVARFDRLLAKITLPAGETVDATVSKARVLATGHEDKPLEAERVALAALADPVTGGQTLLFAVRAGDLGLQPGAAVTAFLQLPGEPSKGVIVPRSAVIRFAGRAWAYVQTGEDKFTRREVALHTITPQGWFMAKDFKAGEPVVVSGALGLMATELKLATVEEEE